MTDMLSTRWPISAMRSWRSRAMPMPSRQPLRDRLNEFVTIKDAAELMQCSVKSIRRALDDEKLAGVRDGKFWKFKLVDLLELLWGPEKNASGDEDTREGEAPAE